MCFPFADFQASLITSLFSLWTFSPDNGSSGISTTKVSEILVDIFIKGNLKHWAMESEIEGILETEPITP